MSVHERGRDRGRCTARPIVLLVLALLLCPTDVVSSSFGTSMQAQKSARDSSHSEHGIRRNILVDMKALPLNSHETDDLALKNVSVQAHYKSNVELEAALRNFTQHCGHISRLYSIGNSTLGVPLWVIEISDKPGKAEPEPAFKYVGNMHGDEPLGRELVLLLAEWLCDNYLKDSLATLIVEKVHLHLLPSMNPDGFAAKPVPTRNNAHDFDLNRNFPDQFFPENNDEQKREAETRAVMSWIRSTRFTASASFHEGALVANYPYDGTHDISTKYSVSPDDSTFKYLAGVYAQNHPLMFKSKEFAGGITNGAAWYPLYGGMQDWNYLNGDCLELTLEMNEDKWPPPSKVPKIWSEHRKSMLQLVAATVTSGVHGRVMSSEEGHPLAATISVSGIGHPVTASAKFGDFHRLLAPGKVYEVTASMADFHSRTTSIFLANGTAVMLDFILDPLHTDAGHARGGGEGLTIRRNFPPAPQKKSGRKELVNELAVKDLPADGEKQTVKMFSWRPAKSHRKELQSNYVQDHSVLSMQLRLIYLIPFASVAVILVCLLLKSRGFYRYQTQRQRGSEE